MAVWTGKIQHVDEKSEDDERVANGLSDEWDDDVALTVACKRAIRILAQGPRRGIIKPLRTITDFSESKPKLPEKNLRFKLTPIQQEKADLPYREVWDLRKGKRNRNNALRPRQVENLSMLEEKLKRPAVENPTTVQKFIVDLEVEDDKVELSKVEVNLPEVVVEQTVQYKGGNPTSECFQSAKEFLQSSTETLKIPDNVDDFVIITEYSQHDYEDIKLDDDVEINENADAFFGFWRRLIKLEPQYSL